MSAKLVFFDLETTNLNANYGYVLCIAWKALGDKVTRCVSIDQSPKFQDDPTNDSYVVETVAKELAKSDIVCGWYSSRFDWPYMQSRLLAHGLPTMPPIPHIDLWRTAKYQMKLNSNRLASVAEFLGLAEKTPIRSREWIRAMAGHKKSIKYVIDHCKQDILVLEQAYVAMRPVMKGHPNINIVSDDHVTPKCPICASPKLHKRGFSIATVNKVQRFQCQGCGGWSRGKPERIKELEIR